MNGLPGVRGSKSSGLSRNIFAIDRAPHQPAVGVDVDLRHAQLGGRQILVLVHAAGVAQLAARLVDPLAPIPWARCSSRASPAESRAAASGSRRCGRSAALACPRTCRLRATCRWPRPTSRSRCARRTRPPGRDRSGRRCRRRPRYLPRRRPACPVRPRPRCPFRAARSTTRRVMAMFSSNVSCEASIITDE